MEHPAGGDRSIRRTAAALALTTLLAAGCTAPVAPTPEPTPVISPSPTPSPDEIWSAYTSDRFGFSMAHPKGWEIDLSLPDSDAFFAPDGSVAWAGRELLVGQTLPKYAATIIGDNRRDFGVDPDEDESSTLAGAPARLLTYQVSIEDRPYQYLQVLTIIGSHGYQVLLLTPSGHEAAGRSLFEQIMGTFKPLP
jgi:hypothetical protein